MRLISLLLAPGLVNYEEKKRSMNHFFVNVKLAALLDVEVF